MQMTVQFNTSHFNQNDVILVDIMVIKVEITAILVEITVIWLDWKVILKSKWSLKKNSQKILNRSTILGDSQIQI